MKKIFSAAAAACMLAVSLSGCTAGHTNTAENNSSRLNIVATIFPEYDWVREIVGDTDNAEVTMLLGSGVDMHSYNPTAADIMKLSSCDMFIYVGGESDKWVEDALAEAVNPDMRVINLIDVLGSSVKKEEIKEGMESANEADGDEPEYDEHVWLSLKNAKTLVSYISDELCDIDEANSAAYKVNTAAYLDKLDALDARYGELTADAPQKILLFGDRFPFRYMTDDYGLDYYAAFPGCEAETEASFETIVFLSNKVDELGLSSVMAIDGANHSIAETIIRNTASKDQQLLVLDSMQSTTSMDADNGATYLSIMEENLDTLSKALN